MIQTQHPYQNPDLCTQERVDDLVSQMTLDEKIAQMIFDAPAIDRLNVAKHNWWNECLHGVARAGVATVFPQAIGMAATFNPALIHQAATSISDEARAKHHKTVRRGIFQIYTGLTYWTPNINRHFLEKVFAILALDPSLINCQPALAALRTYGAIGLQPDC